MSKKLKIAGAAEEAADVLAASFVDDNRLVLAGKSVAEVEVCTLLEVDHTLVASLIVEI